MCQYIDIEKANREEDIQILIFRYIAAKERLFTYEEILTEVKKNLINKGGEAYVNCFFINECISNAIEYLADRRKLSISSSGYVPLRKQRA